MIPDTFLEALLCRRLDTLYLKQSMVSSDVQVSCVFSISMKSLLQPAGSDEISPADSGNHGRYVLAVHRL
jgi:hypothetical protein